MQASSKDAEDDASRNYSDFYAKEGIASQTKRVTLNYEDFKEVNYLQDLLKDSKAKELTPTIRNYVFDEKEYPLIQVGSEEYREYDPLRSTWEGSTSLASTSTSTSSRRQTRKLPWTRSRPCAR